LRLGCRDGLCLPMERLNESGCDRGIFHTLAVEMVLDVSFETAWPTA